MRRLPREVLGRRRRRGTRGPKPAPLAAPVLGLPTTPAARLADRLSNEPQREEAGLAVRLPDTTWTCSEAPRDCGY